ncbi:MAG: hypothetical protein QHJ73_03955, partial [Armatimonadota bacterium]|nr:hypothetical protein [Armatimonadota bacterium]
YPLGHEWALDPGREATVTIAPADGPRAAAVLAKAQPAPAAAPTPTLPAALLPAGGRALDSGAQTAAPAAAGTRSAARASGAAKPPIPITPEVLAIGKRLCDDGDRLLAEKRYAEAEACYRVVLCFLPDSPRAKAGLQKVTALAR